MAYKKKNSAAPAVIIISLLVIIAAVVMMVFMGGDGKGVLGKIKDDILSSSGSQNSTQLDLIDKSALPDATTPVQETNEQGDTQISFNGNDITIDGQGAAASGNTVLIVQSGVYRLSGTLTDGRVVVNAKGQDVVLILDGVNISCSNSAPFYFYKAASVTLLLNGTTENVISDSTSWSYDLEYCNSAEEEPNACLFSKADLIIRGTGSLKVNGNYNSGIIAKDTLKIINTTLSVAAKNNGINGKDSLTVQNSTLSVEAGGDTLRSTQENDPSLGWARLIDSNIYLTAQSGDGIQTERDITIDNCSISIKTGDNGAQGTALSSSAKGIKSVQGGITVNSGTIALDTIDDALHSVGNITVNGGTISIASGDDALHSDANIYIKGGVIEMPDCHEGLEGALIEISNGELYIVADDDGVNASGGNDSSGEPGGMFASDGSYLGITGGLVYISSMGDGIDSNGDIYMSGGTLIISGPTSGGEGAIDYNGDFHIDGGLLFAAGSKEMAQAPDNMTVNALSVSFDDILSAGSYVSVSGGGKEFVFMVEKDTGNIVFASPELEAGVEYTISYGGKYSGEVKNCIASGGKYSGGKELATVALTQGLNSYGSVGIGGSRGGGKFGEAGQFGGMHGEGKINPLGDGGMGMDGNPGGNPPKLPDNMTNGELPPQDGMQPPEKIPPE